MRAHTVEAACEIAIKAKHAKAHRKAGLFELTKDTLRATATTVRVATILDMIKREKKQVRLAAAGTTGRFAAVGAQYLCPQITAMGGTSPGVSLGAPRAKSNRARIPDWLSAFGARTLREMPLPFHTHSLARATTTICVEAIRPFAVPRKVRQTSITTAPRTVLHLTRTHVLVSHSLSAHAAVSRI